MSKGRSSPHLLIFVFLALLAFGCRPDEGISITSEVDEPHFRRGQQLVRSGRNQEALAAFLKVIEKRGDGAPESHLEAGLLNLQHIRDPIAAIYHFRKYLELRPTSPQADLVRQRIEAATREFARALPAQPLKDQVDRLDMAELVDRLQKENLLLKQELAAARQASGTSQGAILTEMPQPRPEPAAQRPAAPSAPSVASAAPPPAPAYRKHVVGPGDNLFRISMKYYGTAGKMDLIFEANRDVISDRNQLRVGMELKIP